MHQLEVCLTNARFYADNDNIVSQDIILNDSDYDRLKKTVRDREYERVVTDCALYLFIREIPQAHKRGSIKDVMKHISWVPAALLDTITDNSTEELRIQNKNCNTALALYTYRACFELYEDWIFQNRIDFYNPDHDQNEEYVMKKLGLIKPEESFMVTVYLNSKDPDRDIPYSILD